MLATLCMASFFGGYHRVISGNIIANFFERALVDSAGCVGRFTLCRPLDPECVGIVVVHRISMAYFVASISL